MTPRENFFRDFLIPTGQLAHLVLLLTRNMRTRTSKVHAERANAIWDILNLAAGYAAQHDGSFVQLQGALDDVQLALSNVFDALGAKRKAAVKALMTGTALPTGTDTTVVLRKSVEQLDKQLPTLAARVYVVIGYTPTQRHVWLARMCIVTSPLTFGTKVGTWRTLVRNTSWERGMLLAGGSEILAAPGFKHHNRFNCDSGRKRAAAMMEKLFPATAEPLTAAVAPEVVTPSSEATAEAGALLKPLPAGIAVASTTSGLLRVVTRFDASSLVSKALLTKVKAAGNKIPEDLAKLLAPQEFSVVCDIATLGKTVADAEAWLKAQPNGEELTEVAQRWEKDARVAAVKEKLNRNFNEDERKLLAELLV